MTGDLWTCVQQIKLSLDILLSVHAIVWVLFVPVFCDFLGVASAAAIEASLTMGETGPSEEFRQMGRENVHSKGDAESGSNIIIPLDGKVFVLSTKDWNKAIGLQLLYYFAVALFYIEINQEQDAGDIHKLHDGNLLELAQCLVVLSMMFLQKRNIFKYDANENIYGWN